MPAEEVVGEGAGVARGEDVRVLGAEHAVDDDAVVDGEAGGRGELDPRDDADRDQHRIARDLAAVVEADAGDTVRRRGSRRPGGRGGYRRRPRVAGAHPLLDRGGHGAGHQPRAGLDHRHLRRPSATAFDATSRPMKPPPITTSRLPLPRRARSVSGIRDVAHGGHAGEVGSGYRQPPRRGAGRKQEPLIGNDRPVGEDDLARCRAESGSRWSRRGARSRARRYESSS